ncbi:aflatoxin b1 aldehyde reductase member 3 [Trichoderma arundinaceum]|uniref:Aflatoxin b1 aldehyde reductase member 3 n=1 Tax=Trichoderma arundinaceum TaxID=490622 RepID=A0A395NZP5_TRIAR|nr:aflatoxin b1 aldehyde reductase member 3 [Trichoderma arundinaceum]
MPGDSPIALVVGTAAWVPEDESKLKEIISIMRARNVNILDTALVYGSGASEKAIGNLQLGPEISVDTKAPTGFVDGQAAQIEVFGEQSLAALQTQKVRTYFLHGPDTTVPFEEQLEAIQKLYVKGSFERFGISNFSEEQVISIYDLAKSKGYVLPTVYQGSYSLVARHHETGLYLTLRKLGISIEAYSPMAAGFLAKTPEFIEQGKGNWDPNTFLGKFYRELFYKPAYMKLLGEFGTLSEKSGISRVGLAYRWVRHHSFLKSEKGDEMIVGVSSPDHLTNTLDELEGGPLEPWIIQRIEELWDLVKDEEPVDNVKSSRKLLALA